MHKDEYGATMHILNATPRTGQRKKRAGAGGCYEDLRCGRHGHGKRAQGQVRSSAANRGRKKACQGAAWRVTATECDGRPDRVYEGGNRTQSTSGGSQPE